MGLASGINLSYPSLGNMMLGSACSHTVVSIHEGIAVYLHSGSLLGTMLSTKRLTPSRLLLFMRVSNLYRDLVGAPEMVDVDSMLDRCTLS